MQLAHTRTRVLALVTSGILALGTLFSTAPVRADDAKNLKYGAIGLGVVGAYMLSKGKNLEGAAGGAYYAYKKGEDKRQDAASNRSRLSRNTTNGFRRSSRDVYPSSRTSSNYYNGSLSNRARNDNRVTGIPSNTRDASSYDLRPYVR